MNHIEAPTLFEIEPFSRLAGRQSENRRQDRIDAAFAHADTAFKEAYTAFVLLYAASHKDFIGEEVSDAYKADKSRPQPREWRATGGIYQRLVNGGLIQKTGGSRERHQGSLSAVYRLVRGAC